jgi:cardiolipin synthase A/B
MISGNTITGHTIKQVDSYGYYSHNQVQLIKGGRDYFDLLEKLINQAVERIHLQTYIFEADHTGKKIARALVRAAKRGVKVAILLDGYASQNLPDTLYRNIEKAGIHLNWFQPLLKSRKFYFGRRLHHKVVLIDSTHVLVGGLNISDRYNDFDKQNAWLDWAIYARGDIAKPIRRICEHRSKISLKQRPLPGADFTTEDFPECKVRTRINDWVNRKMQVTNSYMEMFRKAQSRIIIMSPYFMPGKTFKKKLSQATRRGVRVQIILGSQSDVTMSRYAERYLYPWLLRNNIEIYEYQRNVLHGKIATYDGKWTTCGSYNINNISAYASVELNLDVENVAFAATVESELIQIIEQDCQQITLDHYNKSINLFQLFLQRSAYDILRIVFFLFTFYFRQKD